MGTFTDLAFVGGGVIEYGEEGLAVFAIFPVGFTGGFIPNFTTFGDVVVFFAVVGAIVAGFAEVLREELYVIR